jgi:hypothetical protein
MAKLSAILDNPALLFVDTFLPSFPAGSQEHALLSVFAYGTWADYRRLEKSLPANLRLDPGGPAAAKLKKLTLLTIFASAQTEFKFEALLSELTLSSAVDLESLVIDLLSAELLDAKIDEQQGSIFVARATARCVRNDKKDVLAIVDKIRGIRQRIGDALRVADSPAP